MRNSGKMMILPYLETERLMLRPQQAEYAAPLIELWLDPEVTHYMSGPRDRDRLESAFAENRAEQYDLWPVLEKESEKVVGHCGLLEKEIELIYIFSPEVWGRGYGVEIGSALVQFADEELGQQRLIALIEPENLASARVAEKLGFRLEKEVIRPGGHVRQLYILKIEQS